MSTGFSFLVLYVCLSDYYLQENTHLSQEGNNAGSDGGADLEVEAVIVAGADSDIADGEELADPQVTTDQPKVAEQKSTLPFLNLSITQLTKSRRPAAELQRHHGLARRRGMARQGRQAAC